MANKQTNEPNINIDISDGGIQQTSGGAGSTNNIKSMNLDSTTRERSGLSKDELMKYANQPFWVRLRNILFATFWILWLSILAAAIGYVYQNPNCKAGPLMNDFAASNVTTAAPLPAST